jgi:hypothetical protein
MESVATQLTQLGSVSMTNARIMVIARVETVLITYVQRLAMIPSDAIMRNAKMNPNA